jgi:hypothetical protein
MHLDVLGAFGHDERGDDYLLYEAIEEGSCSVRGSRAPDPIKGEGVTMSVSSSNHSRYPSVPTSADSRAGSARPGVIRGCYARDRDGRCDLDRDQLARRYFARKPVLSRLSDRWSRLSDRWSRDADGRTRRSHRRIRGAPGYKARCDGVSHRRAHGTSRCRLEPRIHRTQSRSSSPAGACLALDRSAVPSTTRRALQELAVREIRLEEDVDPDRPLRRPLGAARYRFYTPYWLNALVRPIFRPLVNRADRKQLQNLARLAEERSAG